MKRGIALAVLVLCLAVTATWGWNYYALQQPLSTLLSDDSRNHGIEARAHFGSYIQAGAAVFDLRSVAPDKTKADVFRVFLQFASAVKGRKFERVELAYKGVPKFRLDGSYFHQLGEEYAVQNPVYTMRTFPEHLFRPDGTRAFGEWTGGWLGVLNKQLEDFTEFHKQWYVDDVAASSSH